MIRHLIGVVILICITITTTSSQICNGPLSVTIEGSTSGTPLSVTGDEVQPICNVLSGTLTGSIDITAANGSPAYTYVWTGPGTITTSEDQTGLGSGTYNVTVTDTQGCTVTAEYVLLEPTEVVVIGVPTDLDCNSGSGLPTGGIDITASGGQGTVEGDYTYSWSTGDGSGLTAGVADQTGLSAGTYEVTVTDANGCTDVESWTLSEPTAVVLSGTTTDLTCNAANGPADGEIDIDVVGGQGTVEGDYTYSWSTGDGSGLTAGVADQTGLSAGTYEVTVTDANGCTDAGSFTLTEPVIISILASATDLACNSVSGIPDGAIDITVSGGTLGSGYSYAWTTSDGANLVATDEDQTGLTAGTYTVVVTDGNGCTQSDTYTLTEPTPVTVAEVIDQPDCNAGSGALDGGIDITAGGGTPGYTYSWTGPGVVASSEDQLNLGTGTYNVTVTDVNGCTVTAEYTLTEPTPVAIAEVLDQPDCNVLSGVLDGGIDITASGGTGGYTYSWTGPGSVVAAAEDQTGLGTGTYEVTVTDANGCTATASYDLTEPTAVEVAEVIDQPDCNVLSGVLDGEIDITASGGTGVYTYNWTGPDVVAADEDQVDLGTGTYNVTVTDANGCTVTAEYTLTEPTPVTVAEVLDQPDCNTGSGALDGGIDITAGGGTPGYTYAWTGPGVVASSEDQVNLGTGTYNVTVTDANGCTVTASYDLTEPSAVTVAEVIDQPDCNAGSGLLDGGIDITAGGGTPGYTYAWTGPGVVASSEDQVDLGTGTYNVTVTDANGCTVTAEYTLTEPTPVAIAEVLDQPDCNVLSGVLDGEIDITASGGTGGYTYSWTGPGAVVAADEDQTGLGTGTYNVTVTDANGCTATATYDLTEPTAVEVAEVIDQPDCNVLSGVLDGEIDITASGGTGGYTYSWTGPGAVVAADEDQTGLGTGTYNVTVTDANGCTVTAEYTLTEPTPVTVADVIDQPDCNTGSGALDGGIDITAGGGTPGYTYAWTGPGVVASSEDQVNLGTGTYNVTVTDANGCTVTATYDLTEPTPVAVAEVLDQPDCNVGSGTLDGGIDITASGGTPGYTYNWSGPGVAAASEDQTGLGTGTYTVTVTDANGCTVVASYDLTEPTPVAIAEVLDQPDCNVLSGVLDGEIDITASGGTGGYTYNWTGPGSVVAADEDQAGLGTGTYNVTVTDANGCTATATYDLTEPTPVAVADVIDEPDCNVGSGTLDGGIDITASGGTPGYTYNWTGPAVIAAAEDQINLGGGTYNVTITDANGCTVTASYILTEPAAVTVTEVLDQPDCNVGSGTLDGGIDITAAGGTGGYTYNWTGPNVIAASEDQTGLGTGTYDVTITDANGCQVIAQYTLTEPTEVVVAGGTVDLDCNSGSGAPTGSIDIIASGGQGTLATDYTYSWTTSDGGGLVATAEDQSNLTAGTYNVTITDANGCTGTNSFTLTEPTAVDVTANTIDLTCNAANGPANGEIDVVPSGGQGSSDGDYTYVWDSPDGAGLSTNAGDQTGLTAGTYNVTVTDSNGCTAEGSWTLTEPTIISILASATDLACNAGSGAADGAIDITVSGGTVGSGYTYAWTTVDGSGLNATADDQTGLTAGTYVLVVTDGNGCTQQDQYTLTQPDAVEVSGVQTDLTCNALSGAPTGEIDITAVGGQGTSEGDYTYAWTTVDGSGLNATAADQTGLSAGTYTVVVTDINLCTDTETWVLGEPDAVECTLDSPVVGAGGTNILCFGETGTINVTATGGTAPYEYSLDGGATTQTDPSFDVVAGTYTVTTIDANGCESTCDITLTEPPLLIAGTCVVEDECQLNAGEIEVGAEGGVGPYTVTWTSPTGGTLNETTLTIATSGGDVTFTGAQGGETYIFTVTDANGCDL